MATAQASGYTKTQLAPYQSIHISAAISLKEVLFVCTPTGVDTNSADIFIGISL